MKTSFLWRAIIYRRFLIWLKIKCWSVKTVVLNLYSLLLSKNFSQRKALLMSQDVVRNAVLLKSNKIVVKGIVTMVAISVRNAKCTQRFARAVENKQRCLSNLVVTSRYIAEIVFPLVTVNKIKRDFLGINLEKVFFNLRIKK